MEHKIKIKTLNRPKNEVYTKMEDDCHDNPNMREIPSTPQTHRAPIPQPRSARGKPLGEGAYLAPLTKQQSDEIYAEIPSSGEIPPIEKPPRSRRVPTAYGVGNFKR